jgi:hypothetical protein
MKLGARAIEAMESLEGQANAAETGVGLGDGIRVGVAAGEGVAVGAFLVGVGAAVGEAVGDAAVGVGVGFGVRDGVGVGRGVRDGVAVGTGLGDGVTGGTVGADVLRAVGVAEAAACVAVLDGAGVVTGTGPAPPLHATESSAMKTATELRRTPRKNVTALPFYAARRKFSLLPSPN